MNLEISKKSCIHDLRLFAGIDILDRCHLITISSYRQPFTYLSVNRMTQVAGRCRNGNISETIIYDIAQREIRSEYANSKDYRQGLISRAEAYANFLNQMRTMIEEDRNLIPLEAFLDSYVDFAARSKPDQQSYPLRIIRQNCIDKKFVPAYFNIDALLERWNLYHDLYSDKENLKVKLSENNAVHFEEELITEENHNALAVSRVKANNRERMERTFPDLKNKLQEWYMDGMNEAAFKEIINGYDKNGEMYVKRFTNYVNIYLLMHCWMVWNTIIRMEGGCVIMSMLQYFMPSLKAIRSRHWCWRDLSIMKLSTAIAVEVLVDILHKKGRKY